MNECSLIGMSGSLLEASYSTRRRFGHSMTI